MVRSERFELPALGIEIRCSIQLSYERAAPFPIPDLPEKSTGRGGRFSRRRLNSQPAGKSAELGFWEFAQQLRTQPAASPCA